VCASTAYSYCCTASISRPTNSAACLSAALFASLQNPKVTADRAFNGFGTNYTNSPEPIYGTQVSSRLAWHVAPCSSSSSIGSSRGGGRYAAHTVVIASSETASRDSSRGCRTVKQSAAGVTRCLKMDWALFTAITGQMAAWPNLAYSYWVLFCSWSAHKHLPVYLRALSCQAGTYLSI
jgi:hypothetical protein